MTVVQTVTGEVPASELGVTLMHEHVFINGMAEERSTGLLNDYELMCQEVSLFAAAGGRTLVDLTTCELTSGASADPTGRYGGHPATGHCEEGTRATNNVHDLVRLSKATGVNVVLGTGHYRDPFLEQDWFDRVGTAGVTERIVQDLMVGIGATGVRAGIIGEIGADKWFVSATEERSFRAAARAQRATGAAISTHAARWPVGIEQLDILVAEGADPRRVIIGHCDTVNIPEYHEEIAARGAFVQFDTVRGLSPHDTQRRVDLVRHLAQKGLLPQLLLSHDVCSRTHLHAGGGNGYDFIPVVFVRLLKEAGLAQDDIELVITDNPRRALSLQ